MAVAFRCGTKAVRPALGAGPGCHHFRQVHLCQQVRVRIKFERLDEGGLGLIGDPGQG
jgi:hypothetical protein